MYHRNPPTIRRTGNAHKPNRHTHFAPNADPPLQPPSSRPERSEEPGPPTPNPGTAWTKSPSSNPCHNHRARSRISPAAIPGRQIESAIALHLALSPPITPVVPAGAQRRAGTSHAQPRHGLHQKPQFHPVPQPPCEIPDIACGDSGTTDRDRHRPFTLHTSHFTPTTSNLEPRTCSS